MADKLNALARAPVNALSSLYDLYQRRVGQPFQQAVRGGVRGYFGLPLMSDADPTGREAYRQGEALGYTPGVGMPAGAVRVAAEGVQALPSIAGEIGRVIAGMPSGAGAAQAEDFARYQRSIPPSDVSPLTAFHGTPHTFDPTAANPLGEFRSSAIGSGEGAQAFGYGTYFAESPGVAKSYRDTLSKQFRGDTSTYAFNGKPTSLNEFIFNAKSGHPELSENDAQNAAHFASVFNDKIQDPFPASSKVWDTPFGKAIASDMQGLKKTSGSLYTVDIPDSMVEKMLDWDKPLSDQPKTVQDALEKAGLWSPDPSDTGRTVYELLVRKNSTKMFEGGKDRATSQYLSSIGIPGIRYLDRSSRAVGEGTRNIVVFPGEESKVKILKRE
jgi:hypothetical protein